MKKQQWQGRHQSWLRLQENWKCLDVNCHTSCHESNYMSTSVSSVCQSSCLSLTWSILLEESLTLFPFSQNIRHHIQYYISSVTLSPVRSGFSLSLSSTHLTNLEVLHTRVGPHFQQRENILTKCWGSNSLFRKIKIHVPWILNYIKSEASFLGNLGIAFK